MVDQELLDMPWATAQGRLRKLLLWSLIQETDKDICFRCGKQIEDVDDLSVDHLQSWRSADDPQAAFFALTNITFSHLRCNVAVNTGGRRNGTHCQRGHLLGKPDSNGWKKCQECKREGNRRYNQRQRLARSYASVSGGSRKTIAPRVP